MNRTGMTALMIATSVMDSPRDYMCKFKCGYRTVMEADWKKKMSLIQTRCFILKSWNTHRTMVEIFWNILEQQPNDPGPGVAAGTNVLPDNPLSDDFEMF